MSEWVREEGKVCVCKSVCLNNGEREGVSECVNKGVREKVSE